MRLPFGFSVLAFTLATIAPTTTSAQTTPDLPELTRRAEAGDSRSQALLGMERFYGDHGPRDYAEAYRWLRLAAEKEDPLALFHLGLMYERGHYAERDTIRAYLMYSDSACGLLRDAASGDPVAQSYLGLLYNLGRGVPQNSDSAAYWVRRSAETGYPRAQYYAGFYYYHGVGSEPDFARAEACLKKASHNGVSPAQGLLANMYFNGQGILQDIGEAKRWLSLAETYPSASENIVDGVYHMSGIPQEGDHVILGLLPPRTRLRITEGDCGEACVWTLLRAWGYETTEIDINEDVGAPGRGLHSYEFNSALDEYGLEYRNTMSRRPIGYVPLLLTSSVSKLLFPDRSMEEYRSFLYDEVIPSVLGGTSVILGVKVYPRTSVLSPLDHFILVVGYNQTTDEIIYNSHNQRERMKAAKLLDRTDGYSLINMYRMRGAVFVPLPEQE